METTLGLCCCGPPPTLARSWMQQFATHQPERHDPGAETMVDILTLQIWGGTEKIEEVRDWMVGLAQSVALLQELWHLELRNVD